MGKTVLLVDDHPLFRRGLASAIEHLAPRVKVEEADSVVAALDRIAQRGLDLILYDWHLPSNGGGLRGLLAICQLTPAVPVVVISADEEEAIRIAALKVGASDFLAKSADTAVIRELIARFLNGHAPVDPTAPHLTERERVTLRHIVQGHSNKRIARELNIAATTVRGHVSKILKALHAANRTEAASTAIRLGLVEVAEGKQPTAAEGGRPRGTPHDAT